MTLFLVLPWTRPYIISYNIVKMGNIGNFGQGVRDLYRPRTEAPRKKHHLVQSVFFILLVTAAIYVMLQSPLFEIKTIEIKGNRQLQTEELRDFSGINIGTNIFKLNLGECEERLSMLPLLKTATLERKLPAKVVVNVTERKAVALVPYQNSLIKVDNDGVYLQKGTMASALPVITGLSIKESGPGKPVESSDLPLMLSVLDQLPRTLIQQLSELHINKSGQLLLYTVDGTQGRLGLSKDIEYKGMVFEQVITNLKQSGGDIDYIDLSNPKVPVVKYSKHQQEGVKP